MSGKKWSRSSKTRRKFRLELEQLEGRLAPATLVNPNTLTYRDVDGDAVTVTSSNPIFSAGTINNVFHFDTGTVDGSNLTAQQLQLIDLTGVSAAQGTNLTIKAVRNKATHGNGQVNVGHIDATGIDLGQVQIVGDLGAIDAGDADTSTPGLVSLSVRSIGRLGTSTQASGGDLQSDIVGKLGQ